MIQKKVYSTPQMTIVMVQQQQALLTGSYDGPANAINYELDDLDFFDKDLGTFSNDDLGAI